MGDPRQQDAPTEPPERIRGIVLRTTYENPDNDYRVIKIEPLDAVDPSRLDKRREMVVVGALPGIEAGQCIEAEGRWSTHPKHGAQFKADWYKPSMPTGARGIEAYLSSGAIKGVGKVIAKRIVAKFGDKTFEIMEENMTRLREVQGISQRKVTEITHSWRESRLDRELITFLGEHGISPAWASRLRKAYGGAALSIVRSNPYRLAAEVRGVGFHRADVMARRFGLPLDSPERMSAAIGHVLESQSGDGNTCLPRPELIELATKLLELDQVLVEKRLADMIERGLLSVSELAGEEHVFLNSLYEAEREIARHLLRLSRAKRRVPVIKAEEVLEQFQRNNKFELAPAQRGAALTIAREGIMVLTGGPGTGKTTTLRSVIDLFQAAHEKVRLAAPTGRAARRLSETSKINAETIHRLLGFNAHTGQFTHNASQPIEADLVVIDEASMLDVTLARDLLAAISSGTCVMFVGDEDQLPSVGPGNVLRDIINSSVMPVARLHEIFRQAQSSLIVVNAHRINRGEPPMLTPPPEITDPDFFFIERNEPAEVMETIKTLMAERIPNKYRLDPKRDVQVLTPMRRGELGSHTINRELQKLLNPPKKSAKVAALEGFDEENDGPQILRASDRVMQTANNYDKEVFNGDVGIVRSIDDESGEVIVQFEGRAVTYLGDETRQLSLAYAVTIHKSQGSEYRAVVIPLHTQHYIMLKRNLLYTAITRGKELVCVVGNKTALWRAVRDASVGRRNSALGEFIKSAL